MQAFLRRQDVERATGLPRSTLYAKISQGDFPKPVKIGGRAVGWLEAEIAEWQRTRVEARDRAVPGSRAG